MTASGNTQVSRKCYRYSSKYIPKSVIGGTAVTRCVSHTYIGSKLLLVCVVVKLLLSLKLETIFILLTIAWF